jgi:hypothetical protein
LGGKTAWSAKIVGEYSKLPSSWDPYIGLFFTHNSQIAATDGSFSIRSFLNHNAVAYSIRKGESGAVVVTEEKIERYELPVVTSESFELKWADRHRDRK